MQNGGGQIIVVQKPSDVSHWLADVIRWADSERNALGFFAASMFEEQARKGNLFVAVSAGDRDHLTYAGHLMFDARQPKAKVLQMFTVPQARRSGAARALLDRLKQYLTERNFISIYANVAEDLISANAFWERNEFHVQRTRAGGKTRKRTILVRCHELNSPQLFSRSGITSENPFGLNARSDKDRPIYLLDLNVLFDLRPRRPRHDAAVDLFRAERHGACQLAVSAELQLELARSASTAPQSDPMHTWASIFVTFPLPPASERAELIELLGRMVFGRMTDPKQYSENDLSDLSHLASAVHHRLEGFITSDAAILNAATKIDSAFGIQVLSPAFFKTTEPQDSYVEAFEATSTGNALVAAPLPVPCEPAVRNLLSRFGVSDSEAISIWGVVDSAERVIGRSAVLADTVVVGYLASPRNADSSLLVGRVVVDESHESASTAARLLLNKFLSRACDVGPSRAQLHLAPKQVIVREVAAALGFAGTSEGSTLSKIVLNRIVTPGTWMDATRRLSAMAQLKLPSASPCFKGIDQLIDILCPDGNRRFVSLGDIESGLSPALLCLAGRPAVITPIQRNFSEVLLGYSMQSSMLPTHRTAQYAERHYISAEKTLRYFTRGTIILFYESGKNGGASAVVAAARVQRSYLKREGAIDEVDLDRSVLSTGTLASIGRSSTKAVTAFDNLIRFDKPVSLTNLKKFGCGKPQQLISTRPINSVQLEQILALALST